MKHLNFFLPRRPSVWLGLFLLNIVSFSVLAQAPDSRPLPPWAQSIEAKYLGMRVRISVPNYRIGDSAITGFGLLPWKRPVEGTSKASNRLLETEYNGKEATIIEVPFTQSSLTSFLSKDEPHQLIERVFRIVVQFDDGTTAVTTGELSTVEELFVPLFQYVDVPRVHERMEEKAFAESRERAVAQAARGVPVGQSTKTDAEIKQEIIRQSIASYRGSCPCPYSVDRAGRMCGRRSAYSKPGGASPICYEKDVTQKMVDDYRRKTK